MLLFGNLGYEVVGVPLEGFAVPSVPRGGLTGGQGESQGHVGTSHEVWSNPAPIDRMKGIRTGMINQNALEETFHEDRLIAQGGRAACAVHQNTLV